MPILLLSLALSPVLLSSSFPQSQRHTPLWLHALVNTMVASLLDGLHLVLQELSWVAGYDDAEERKRPLFLVALEAVLLALHRPLAV